jgi:hypothetical protein
MGTVLGRPSEGDEGGEEGEADTQRLKFSVGDPKDATSSEDKADDGTVFEEATETSYTRSQSLPAGGGGHQITTTTTIRHTESVLQSTSLSCATL